MNGLDSPAYLSRPTGKSMGNEYRIYCGRIELRCRFPFFSRTLVIRKDELVSIEVFKPPVIRSALWALKLDLADLHEHVGIKRTKGLFKQLRFTPDDPRGFVAKVTELFGRDR